MLALAAAAAVLAAKALGACVLAFLAVSLVPWLQDVWATRNIPPFVPAPPFIGDLPTLAVKGMHVVFGERAKKYASYPAFRVFVGNRVWIITSDPESGRRLMTRLLNRTRFVQIAEDETALGGGRDLATLRGERWRRMRLAWLPTFSPPSLARYAPLMDGCAKRLADRLEPYGASGEPAEVWRMIGALTLDVVGTCAFGTRFNTLAPDEGDEKEVAVAAAAADGDDDASIDGKRLVFAARTIFARGSLTTGSGYQALAIMFPLGTPLWKMLAKRFPDHNLRELNEARRTVSDAAMALLRRKREEEAAAAAAAAKIKGEEAAKDDDDAANGHDQQPRDGKAPVSAISSGIMPGSFLAQLMRPAPARGGAAAEAPPPLEDADAVAQASLFILAGYETTASTLASCVYALSTNPSAQRRLCAEVDAFFAEHGRGAELTPEAVAGNFPFAEGAVKEALRLYSPVTAIAREVAPLPDNPHELRSDLLHGGGGGDDTGLGTTSPPSLRPGITIAAANYVYQHSPDYWPRADQFLPERWVPEDRGGAASVLGATTPAAWTPFGGGPRQCVGIKFAMLEAVIALARLLERYTFEPAPSQKHPLPLKQALTLSPDGGVNVIVKRRAEYYPGDAAVAA